VYFAHVSSVGSGQSTATADILAVDTDDALDITVTSDNIWVKPGHLTDTSDILTVDTDGSTDILVTSDTYSVDSICFTVTSDAHTVDTGGSTDTAVTSDGCTVDTAVEVMGYFGWFWEYCGCFTRFSS